MWDCGKMCFSDQYCTSPVSHGFRENFPGVHNSAIYQSNSNYANGDYVMCAVEGTADETLLLAVVEVTDELPGVFGAADPAFPYSKITLAQFQRGSQPATPAPAQRLVWLSAP